MGIRFKCRECDRRLNVKEFLAGKRGTCPHCDHKFRIPMEDQEYSEPLNKKRETVAVASSKSDVAPELEPGISMTAHRLESDLGATEASSETPESREPTVASDNDSQPIEDEAGGDEDAVDWEEVNSETSDPETADSEVGSGRSSDSALWGESVVWYVRPPTGGQYGPADSELMQQWIGERRVAFGCLVWRDGWSQWLPAEEVFAGQLVDDQLTDIETNPPEPAGNMVSSLHFSEETPRKISMPGANVGERRRSRRQRRTTMIALLAGVSVLLIGVLAVVIAMSKKPEEEK